MSRTYFGRGDLFPLEGAKTAEKTVPELEERIDYFGDKFVKNPTTGEIVGVDKNKIIGAFMLIAITVVVLHIFK